MSDGKHVMFIIDGHNLLWAVQQKPGGPGAMDELGLCRVISRYLRLVGQAGQIVFDGSGPSDKSGFDKTTHLEVLFAGVAAEADSVIEDVINASTGPKDLTIVSDDRRIRKAAQARKAASMRTLNFWEQVERELKSRRLEQEPAAKEQGLTEGETQQWLDFFGLDQ
jgi:predicted RNA-binding protein with PIN domain